MARYKLVSPQESREIRELQVRLGDRQFRTLLSKEGARIMRPDRIANLAAGRGKLTDAEREQLQRVDRNKVAIGNLTKRGEKQDLQTYRTNRAIRTWLLHGKERDVKRRKDEDELRAIKALRLLGVDVEDGTFYLKGFTA